MYKIIAETVVNMNLIARITFNSELKVVASAFGNNAYILPFWQQSLT